MKKLVLYSHGGSGNRGCEAIVRGTYKIIKDGIQDKSVYLCSLNKQEDLDVNLPQEMGIVSYSNYVKRKSVDHIRAAVNNRLFGNVDSYIKIAQRNLYKHFSEESLAVSIGGDNYCYTDSKWLYLSHNEAKRKKAKTALWGCSLEESNMDGAMVNDLSQYDLIVARESITYELLRRKGITRNTKLYPDPAFQLDYEPVELPVGFREGNTIGINISPYIFKSDLPEDQVVPMYAGFIDHLLNVTDASVAFIPHVFWEHSNDLDVIREVCAQVKNKERVIVVDKPYNCMQMKYIISKCRMFIGARTHSTIAAYSTCVPTFVLGYSVKSRGIARDIFGSEEHMVIPVQSLRGEEDLKRAFDYVLNNEEAIRRHLQQVMPDYKERAGRASEELLSLLHRKLS